MGCLVTFGNISPQRSVPFSLAPPSMSVITGIQKYVNEKGASSVLPLFKEICCHLSTLVLALSELQWLVQALRNPPVLNLHLRQWLQGT